MDFRAVIFVPALAGSVIFGFVFLLFAASYYLTVMESTAVGAKEVTWVSESLAGNAGRLAYVAWLVGIWLGPAYLLGRAMTTPTDPAWIRLAIPLLVFWLCFPVSQLSSLSASTIWLPLVPDVFARMFQKPAVILGFFALSIPTLAAFGLGFKWAFLTDGEWSLLFVGAPLMVAMGLLYARLIGRLAFALRFTKSLFPEKKKRKPKGEFIPAPPPEEPEPTFAQPSELPPISTPDEGDLHGYDVKFEDEVPAPPKKRVKAEAVVEPETESEGGRKPESPAPTDRRGVGKNSLELARVWTEDDDEETKPYGVHEPEGIAPEANPKEVIKPSEMEMKLLQRDDVPKAPKRVWGLDLLAFLAQEGTVMAIVVASGLCFLAGVMVRVARIFNPVAGASE